MIVFLLSVTFLTFATLAVLVFTLRRAQPATIDRQRLNVALFRERRAELDAERATGRIGDAQHAALLAELEALLVDDVDVAAGVDAQRGGWSPRAVAIGLVLALPLLIGSLFYATGFGAPVRDWLALQQRADQVAALELPIDSTGAAQIDIELRDAARLRQTQLQRRPEDAAAWFDLGVTWIDADVPMLALESFRTAQRLAPERTEIKLAVARVELALNNGKLTDEVRGLLDEVLAGDPQDQSTLLLYGMAGFDSGDYDTAIARWQQLLAQIDPQSQGAGMLREGIARAQAKKKELADAMAAPGAAITARIVLAPAMGAVPPDATLFVIVRAVDGPPMPVAAKKLPARLPVEVTITDADQMIPGEPLARRGPLEVRARLSRSGTPMPASGDLESAPVRVDLPLRAPLTLSIDRRLP